MSAARFGHLLDLGPLLIHPEQVVLIVLYTKRKSWWQFKTPEPFVQVRTVSHGNWEIREPEHMDKVFSMARQKLCIEDSV